MQPQSGKAGLLALQKLSKGRSKASRKRVTVRSKKDAVRPSWVFLEVKGLAESEILSNAKSSNRFDRRPKLLGKWKRKSATHPMRSPERTERKALTEPSGRPAVLKGRGKGVRNSVFRSLEASYARGIGVRNSPPPGGTVSEIPKCPKDPRGIGRPKLLGKWERNRLP